MAEPQYSHNHVINPETGFLENPAYAYDFDSQRKKSFLQAYYQNNLRLYRTLDQLGISDGTFNKHYQMDSAFKQAVDKVKRLYTDELEGTSRENALNPKSVIERIFQLKALLPEKYGEAKGSGSTVVNLVFDKNIMEQMKKREEIIEAKIISSTQESDDKQIEHK